MKIITREEAREFDRHAIEDLSVPSICLMENAGRQTADAAAEMAGDTPVLVVCGPGNNGGDGFVVARHLLVRGGVVDAVLVGSLEKLTRDTFVNYNAAVNCGVSVSIVNDFSGTEFTDISGRYGLVIDALLGTGVSGQVREPQGSIINLINESKVQILSVDTPSGLDCNTGEILGACIRADRTVTFIAPKAGFSIERGPSMCGCVTVADIGVPYGPSAYG